MQSPDMRAIIVFAIILFPILAELKEEDPNLSSLKKEGEVATLRLKFEKIHCNFMMFYDFYGDVVFLQYREDKWDYSFKKEVRLLRRGVTYYVDFSYLGTFISYPEPGENDIAKKLAEGSKDIAGREPRMVYIGTFKKYRYANTSDIRF